MLTTTPYQTVQFLGTISEPRNEGVSRQTASLNVDAIEKQMIPAVRRKVAVMDLMETEHQEIGEPGSDKLKETYQNFTTFLRVARERAQLQLDGFSAFIDDIDIDVTRLDSAELQSLDKALFTLNNTIKQLGLSDEEFLKINCNVFNSVRKSIGLVPLNDQRFQEIYSAGISGQPARFFNSG